MSELPRADHPHRTLVGKGKRVIEGINNSSRPARRFREVLVGLLAGDPEPSEARQALARRAATIIVWMEGQDAAALTGAGFDPSVYLAATQTLQRLLKMLELAPTAGDDAPTLTDYLTAVKG